MFNFVDTALAAYVEQKKNCSRSRFGKWLTFSFLKYPKLLVVLANLKFL